MKHCCKIWIPGQTEEDSKEFFKLRHKYKEYREKSTISAPPYTVVIRDADKTRFSNQDLQPLSNLRFFQEPLAFEDQPPKACDQWGIFEITSRTSLIDNDIMDLGLKNSKICRFLRKSSKFYASCSPDSCAGIINYFDNENQPFKLLKTMEVFQDTEQSLSL